MDKIKITKEQRESLESFVNDVSGNQFVTNKQLLQEFIEGDHWYLDFTPEQFALLLCGWYEVEQPFEVGDWVYFGYKDKEYIAKIAVKHDNGMIHLDIPSLYQDGPAMFRDRELRHATPEEIEREKKRRFWEVELGREVGGFRNYDVVWVEGLKGLYEIVQMSEDADECSVTKDGADTEITVCLKTLTLLCPVEKRVDINA